MPWKVTCVLEERVSFVIEADRQNRSMTTPCVAYGISRETVHKWRARYAQGGIAALADVSRARGTQAASTPDWMRDGL